MVRFSASATCDGRHGQVRRTQDHAWSRRWLHGQAFDLPVAPCVLLIVLLGLGLGGGCTHVVKEDAHYFVDGPQQLDPPNGVIPAGTGVWIIGKDEDYKRVWTLDFVIGYVWEDSIVTHSEWKKIEKQRKEREEAIERRSEQKTSGPLGQR